LTERFVLLLLTSPLTREKFAKPLTEKTDYVCQPVIFNLVTLDSRVGGITKKACRLEVVILEVWGLFSSHQ